MAGIESPLDGNGALRAGCQAAAAGYAVGDARMGEFEKGVAFILRRFLCVPGDGACRAYKGADVALFTFRPVKRQKSSGHVFGRKVVRQLCPELYD